MKRLRHSMQRHSIRNAREWVDSNGEIHRRGGPAIEDPTGYKGWYWHGKAIYEHAVNHHLLGPADSAANWTWRYFGNKKPPVNDPGQVLFNAPGYEEIDKT